MNNKERKVITLTGIVLAEIAGSVFGLGLTIAGYLTGWGPGGSMHGPLWRILTTGLLSSLTGILIAILLVRKLAGMLFLKNFSILHYTLLSFVIVVMASIASFIAGWEVAYLTGKITGSISGLEWIAVLFYVPLMSGIYSIPVGLGTGAVFAIFVFFYLKARSGLHKALD